MGYGSTFVSSKKDRIHEKDYINPIICGECGGFWAEFQVVASGLY